jgi:hypothetical protein
MIVNSDALTEIAKLMLMRSPSRDAIAEQWDKALRIRKIQWLPSWLSKWLESNDRSLNYALADAVIELRQVLLEQGALKVKE